MESIATELEKVIEKYFHSLHSITEDDLSLKSSPVKWSKKEIIGHLVDSAQNNIRRFIMAQYEDKPGIIYNQDKWVAISGYQHYDSHDLIELWYFLNKHICHILKNTVPEMLKRECRTENVHSLDWLAIDYVKHLRHHLHQVLDLEPVPY